MDFEDIEFLLAHDAEGRSRQKSLSVFRYGTRRGVDALIERFAVTDTAATWFVPGRVAETQPEAVAAIHQAGHEVAISGYALERLDAMSPQDQATAVGRGRDAVREVTGAAPTGFRLAVGNWPEGFAAILSDLGFTWSSSLGGDDLPYFIRAGGQMRLVEIPRTHVMDDRVAFFWNFSPPYPAGQSRIASYDGVLANWLYELRGSCREGLCTLLQLHPEIIGTPGRRSLVSETLGSDEVRRHAWQPICAQLANWWRQHDSANEAAHPAEVFLRGSGRTAL